jgi:serine/threonine protein kinase
LKFKDVEDFPLDQMLREEFEFTEKDSKEIAEFLLPMLEYDPKKRISARDALNSKWLWS